MKRRTAESRINTMLNKLLDTPAQDLTPTNQSRISIYAELPDEAVLEGYNPKPLNPPGYGVLRVTTLEDFRLLLDTFNETTCRGTIAPEFIKEQIEHERQHGEIAQQLGFRVILYSLTLHDVLTDPQGKVSLEWFMGTEATFPMRPVRKIGLGAMRAAPLSPSDGDEESIRELGYAGGSQEVAERVARYNKIADDPIPLPYFSRSS